MEAGTYYVRVNTYYTSEWAPYTLADSLFKPTQSNDAEPDNNKVQASILPVNGRVIGHINYYYNLKKDTTDWYSLTTAKDGMITINIQSNNGQNVWAYLFDNNGTTILASTYSSSSASYSFDGLKAGTYYIRVNTYYNTEWAPYTLSNSVSYYTFADDTDAEPNNYFRQAKILPANGTVRGHVNFYYNGLTDAADYHKINYTGNGNLTLTFNQQDRFKYGNIDYTWLEVYKDTTASAIYSNYFSSPTSGAINLTGLTEGYYYIKVFTYYNGTGEHFSSYSITNTFTQEDEAKIEIQSRIVASDCSSANSITYKLSGGNTPYTVQLYRFDVSYDKKTVSSTKVVFDNLPFGNYFATVYGDGATGSARGKSDTTVLMPAPTHPGTTNITGTQAKLNWTALPCVNYYSINMVHNPATWNTVPQTAM